MIGLTVKNIIIKKQLIFFFSKFLVFYFVLFSRTVSMRIGSMRIGWFTDMPPQYHCSQIHTRGLKYTNNKNNISEILKVYIINSITKLYILNIKIRPLVTEYALTIKLGSATRLILMRTSVTCGLILIFKIYDQLYYFHWIMINLCIAETTPIFENRFWYLVEISEH